MAFSFKRKNILNEQQTKDCIISNILHSHPLHLHLFLPINLNLNRKRLAITRRSKPTLTKTKSLRMTPSLLVMTSRMTVIRPCSIWAGRGVFESFWRRERNLRIKF